MSRNAFYIYGTNGIAHKAVALDLADNNTSTIMKAIYATAEQ